MTISALILTKNEQSLIEDCLKQLSFADEIIVLDQNSQDETVKIAKKYARVITSNSQDFDKNRNLLASEAKSDWLLYVDADERLPKELIEEIKTKLNDTLATHIDPKSSNQPTRTAEYSAFLGPQSANGRTRTAECSAFYFPRKNFVLGKCLKHGGWWPDYVPRLFKKDKLLAWSGRVHESPKVNGDFGYVKIPLTHLTARSMSQMLKKTTEWAKVEAELFYQANHPPVSIARVVKFLLQEFLTRYIFKFGLLDGQVGFIEALYQALHKSIVLTYLWELQNNAESKFKAISY